jgi:hypothetical protein
VLAEGDCERGGLRVADLLVAALVDLLEEVPRWLVQGRHVATLAGETLDVDRVGEVAQVYRVGSRLAKVV